MIFILSAYNNGLLVETIDASDLLFRYQREDSVHQLPFQGVFWSSRTIFNTVGSADIAKLACGIEGHLVDDKGELDKLWVDRYLAREV